MHKMIDSCPTCGGRLTIIEVCCDACGTQVRSRYTPSPFSTLTAEEQTFLLLFVRSRGNLKEVEKALGVSYPTVRAKLDEVIEALDTAPPAAASYPRREILARVQAGELTASEALILLQRAGEDA